MHVLTVIFVGSPSAYVSKVRKSCFSCCMLSLVPGPSSLLIEHVNIRHFQAKQYHIVQISVVYCMLISTHSKWKTRNKIKTAPPVTHFVFTEKNTLK